MENAVRTATRPHEPAGPLPVPADQLIPLGVIRHRGTRSAQGPISLVAGELSRYPDLWAVYREGLSEAYTRIGAGELVPGPELPSMATTVILAVDTVGRVIGGARVREGTDLHRQAAVLGHAPGIRAAIGARLPEGVNEGCGSWLVPGSAPASLGTALVTGVLRISAGTGRRWTVALVNQLGQAAVTRAGCRADPSYVGLPFPNATFRSTLFWYDHQERRP